jgi:drug/metabolite transporter (DMT)-like permease
VAVRSGDEPVHARSPLRLRLTLALLGVLVAVAGAVYLEAAADRPVAAAVAGAVALAALVDVAVILRHLRQGPHYQPGRQVPAYRPLPALPRPGAGARGARATPRSRQRSYLVLMAVCLALITVAWVWVRLFSTTAAVVMSMVAMVIPPIAAVVANAGWTEAPRDPDSCREEPDDGRQS